MTSPTAAVQNTVKHDPLGEQTESLVKLDYICGHILLTTSTDDNTIEYRGIYNCVLITPVNLGEFGLSQGRIQK